MALRKFKQFVQDHEKPVSRQLELNVLEEETDDSEIADAATVIIGSELSASERRSLSDDFINGIEQDERTWKHNYSNSRGVGVTAANGSRY